MYLQPAAFTLYSHMASSIVYVQLVLLTDDVVLGISKTTLGAASEGKTPLRYNLGFGLGIDGKLKFKIGFMPSLKLMSAALGTALPDLKQPLDKVVKIVEEPVEAVNGFLDKYGISLKLINGLSNSPPYFAMTGSTTGSMAGIDVLVLARSKPTAVMAMVSLNSAGFAGLWMEITKKTTNPPNGTDPFEKAPIFSNMQVAVLASSQSIGLPSGLQLPSPFASMSTIQQGFCFHGQISTPESCRDDIVCTMIAPKEGMYLLLEGCQGVDLTRFTIGVGGISLSDSVKLIKAAMFYEATATSTAFGAEVELSVKLEEWVGFYGSFYLKQVGLIFMIGMKFKTMGLIPNAFGLSRVILFDLYLAGEIGVAPAVPPVPVVNKITIGGGICLGSAQACRELIATASPASRVSYLGARSMEFIETEENAKLDGGLQSFERENARDSARLQKLINNSSPQAIAAKAYLGFEASSGRAFFYAAMSKASLSAGIVDSL